MCGYRVRTVKKPAGLKMCIRDRGRVKILNASVSSLPFQDKSIGLATAVETIYFWPDLKNDFKEVYRVPVSYTHLAECSISPGTPSMHFLSVLPEASK